MTSSGRTEPLIVSVGGDDARVNALVNLLGLPHVVAASVVWGELSCEPQPTAGDLSTWGAAWIRWRTWDVFADVLSWLGSAS